MRCSNGTNFLLFLEGREGSLVTKPYFKGMGFILNFTPDFFS